MEKLSVILVDDETLICKLIRMKVEWEALNMVVIAEFSSSRKALETVPELKPDIIITDICMPGMDGIEFSEECMDLFPSVKIIILTGYDEFSYAKRSIRIGVSDYILKPVNAAELMKSLKDIRTKIYKERERTEEYKDLAVQMQRNLPAFRENYLNQIIQEPVPSEVFRKRMAHYLVELNPKSERIEEAVIEIGLPFRNLLNYEEEDDQIILYRKARKLVEDYFTKDSYMLFFRDGVGRIVVISNNPEVSFMECLELLRKMLVTHLKCYVTIGIGSVKENYNQISSAYREAVEALNYKVVEGNNSLIFYEELDKNRENISSEEERIWKEAKIYIHAGVKEKARKSILTIWNYYEKERKAGRYKARIMFLEICTWAFHKAVILELPDKEEYQRKLEDANNSSYQINEYKKMAVEIVSSLADAMSAREKKKSGSLIHEIISYMSQNLSDPDLSMNKVAGHSFISIGYLGRTLKKNTGKTYGEYLSELRFCKAKELLQDTDLKGYEIGEKIGITDSHYLSIWFKKMSGCSISEYRKKVKKVFNSNNE